MNNFDRITIEQDDNVFEIYPDGVVYYTEGYDADDTIPAWVFEIRDKIMNKKGTN